METSGPTSGIPRQLASTRVAGVQWQVGQLLQATVAKNGIGKVLLAIGNRQVSAETSLPLEKGQQLTLQVRSLGEQPVLRITSALNESPVAMAVRLLLPKHGPMTPLMSSMGQLAHTPNPPTPPLINELIRTLVKQMPDIQTASTPQGVKKAIADSGVFLERHLLQSQRPQSGPVSIDADFKANLLRLVQLVRNWPGSSQTPSAPQQSTAGSPPLIPGGRPSPGIPQPPVLPATPATTPPAQTPAGQPAAAPPAPNLPANPDPKLPPAARPSLPAAPSVAAPGRGESPPAVTDKPATAAPSASPDQLQRGVKASIPAQPAAGIRSTPATTATLSGTPASAAGTISNATGPAPSVLLTGTLPPPFRGSVPVPQSAIQTSLDLLNRMGNFRTDLLQQTEAALSRLQMTQLVAVPREGERGLLEWLFEIPIRRADDIDLWSMRVFRDPQQQPQENRQTMPGWSVQLAFDLPGLGPLQAQIQLSDERISTHFWAAQPETLPLLREHLHELRQALNEAGLEVGDLECHPGPRASDKPGDDHPLISEKA